MNYEYNLAMTNIGGVCPLTVSFATIGEVKKYLRQVFPSVSPVLVNILISGDEIVADNTFGIPNKIRLYNTGE